MPLSAPFLSSFLTSAASFSLFIFPTAAGFLWFSTPSAANLLYSAIVIAGFLPLVLASGASSDEAFALAAFALSIASFGRLAPKNPCSKKRLAFCIFRSRTSLGAGGTPLN